MIGWILDSGYFYALNDSSDKHHAAVSEASRQIKEPIILPVPVITEAAFFVLKNQGVEALAVFLERLSESTFEFETSVSDDYKRAAEIIRQYDDANIDFVDALIVAIAERLGVTKILTVDARHFRMFRPRHCAAFEILP